MKHSLARRAAWGSRVPVAADPLTTAATLDALGQLDDAAACLLRVLHAHARRSPVRHSMPTVADCERDLANCCDLVDYRATLPGDALAPTAHAAALWRVYRAARALGAARGDGARADAVQALGRAVDGVMAKTA
jgi:hypothetical protein